jgi:hypothetical protein
MALGLPEDFRFNILARDRSGPAWRGLRRNVSGASRAVTGFLRSFGPLLGVGGVAGLGAITAQALDTAESLESAADRVGLNVEALQELRYAGAQNRVEFAQVDMAVQRFSRRLAEAAQGGGELRQALLDNNIALRNADGSMRSSEDILLDYADAIMNAESEQEQLRLAFKAFDSEGAALVNVFREGREGLQGYADEAREAGIIMEEGLVRRGAEAARTLRELRQSVGAQATQAVLEHVAGLESLAEVLGDIAQFAIRAAAAMGELLDQTGEENAAGLQRFADLTLARSMGAGTGRITQSGAQSVLRQYLSGDLDAYREANRELERIFNERTYLDRPGQLDPLGVQQLVELYLDLARAQRETGQVEEENRRRRREFGQGGSPGGAGGLDTRSDAERERLALARDRLEIENDLELARANGDKAAEAAAEQRLALMERIAAFRSAGFDPDAAEAEARRIQDALDAAQDLAQLAEKEAERRERSERLAERELRHELQLAELRGDDATVRRLERELELRRQIAELTDLGMDEGAARVVVERELDASELARRQGEYRDVFRDAFRDGFLAMLDGNGDALSDWWREYTTRGLERALDAVADQVFNLFSDAFSNANSGAPGGKGGGFLGSFLGNVLGAIGGSAGGGAGALIKSGAGSAGSGAVTGAITAASMAGSMARTASAPAAAQIRQSFAVSVDARGATDPADVEARVKAAIAAARPQILAENEARLPAVIQQLSLDRKI